MVRYLLIVTSILIALFIIPPPPLMSGISFSQTVYSADTKLLRMTLSNDMQYRVFTDINNVAPSMIKATLLQEDQYYYSHIGVNPISLFKALWQTYVKHSRRIGASTITMQVARMRYRINSKTWYGKMLQMLRALQLEIHYSKSQILEAYLNLAPYGNNIEGVGAASLIYFGKSAHDLTLTESMTLAVIPQNPIDRVKHLQKLRNARLQLFTRWLQMHPEDADQKALIQLPLQLKKTFVFLAPHFVDEVLLQNKNQMIQTTLDVTLQKFVERLTRQYIQTKTYLNVQNAAVMLVDTRSMEVKALVGSTNFFNLEIQGQINATNIMRSPGSTLKPFIYALALDQSLIHPGTVLKDVPHSFGSYNPENFDNDFYGPISARDALITSRNIPAIYLAEQLQKPTLYQFLQQANINLPQSEKYYGLALVLGGAEITMQSLISLYAVLANEGMWYPLQFTKSQAPVNGKRLLSREASFLTLDMLSQSPPLQTSLKYAWKTGTSSGYRDAWTIGIVGPYVLAVWVGNVNNQSNQAFMGKDIALPLFLNIAVALRTDELPTPKQLNITKIKVCKDSGMLPTRNCLHKKEVWFIPGKSPIKTCSIHREIAINRITGLRTCHFNKDTKFVIAEYWSSDLLRVFAQAHLQRRLPPVYENDCVLRDNGSGSVPQITSPQLNVHYVVNNSGLKVPLQAIVEADVNNVYWFLNETFLGKVSREKVFSIRAKPGKYVLRVVDDHGRSDARELFIERASLKSQFAT